MEHIQKHIVGYCTILAAVINVIIEKIESGWPHSSQDWTLLILSSAAAFCSATIAYRAPFGSNQPIQTKTP